MNAAAGIKRWVPRWGYLLLAGACAAFAVSVDSQSFMETGIAQHVNDWLAGSPLYGNLAAPPHNLAVYGPLYYVLILPFAWVSRTQGAVLGVRLVCLASIAASLAAVRDIGRTLMSASADKTPGSFFVPLGLSFGILWPESGATWPSSALELWGLAILCRQVRRAEGRTWKPYLVFVLATLVKQNAIGVACGTVLARLTEDRTERVRALRDGVLFGLAIACVQVAVNHATHGAYARAVYLTAVVDSKSVWTAFGVTRSVLVPGAIAVGLAIVASDLDPRVRRLCAGAAAVAATVAIVGVSKAGAGPVYFRSTILCIAALAAASLETLDPRAIAVLAIGLALSFWPSRDQLSAWKQELAVRHPYKAETDVLRRLPPGPVLSELPIVARLAGRDAWVVDPYLYSLAVERGLVVNGLAPDVAACRLAAVLLFRQGFPSKPAFLLRDEGPARNELMTSLERSYREVDGTVDFRLFLPNCAPPGPPTNSSIK